MVYSRVIWSTQNKESRYSLNKAGLKGINNLYLAHKLEN